MDRTKQKELDIQLGNTQKPQQIQYLNFLEKQVEKSQKVHSDVNLISDVVNDVGARVDLLELGQQDLIKKFRILESIAMGSNDDQLQHKRIMDQIYLKVQDIEARMNSQGTGSSLPPTNITQQFNQTREGQNNTGLFNNNSQSFMQTHPDQLPLNQKQDQLQQLSLKLDHGLDQMERRLNQILTKDFDDYLQQREQNFEARIFQVIDAQAKDIAFDFTQLDQRVNDLNEYVANAVGSLNTNNTSGVLQINRNLTSLSENRDPNLLKSTTNLEKALTDLKRELIEKPDTKEIESFKRKVTFEMKEFEKKLKDLGKPQVTFEKDMRALENRLTQKLSKAIQRIGEIMKKQDRKLKGMIDTSESRLQQKQQQLHRQYSQSPISNKSSRNNRGGLFKSQHSLMNMSSNSMMMRSLSPIKQGGAQDSKLEQSLQQQRSFKRGSEQKNESHHQQQIVSHFSSNQIQLQNQDYQSIQTNESAFRKYQSKFKNETPQAQPTNQNSSKKYIRSGVKRDSQDSHTSLSPAGQNHKSTAFKRTISQDQNQNQIPQTKHVVMVSKEKSQPLRRREQSSKERSTMSNKSNERDLVPVNQKAHQKSNLSTKGSKSRDALTKQSNHIKTKDNQKKAVPAKVDRKNLKSSKYEFDTPLLKLSEILIKTRAQIQSVKDTQTTQKIQVIFQEEIYWPHQITQLKHT
eukprot:403338972